MARLVFGSEEARRQASHDAVLRRRYEKDQREVADAEAKGEHVYDVQVEAHYTHVYLSTVRVTAKTDKEAEKKACNYRTYDSDDEDELYSELDGLYAQSVTLVELEESHDPMHGMRPQPGGDRGQAAAVLPGLR